MSAPDTRCSSDIENLRRAWDHLMILAVTPPDEWLSKAEIHHAIQWMRVAQPVSVAQAVEVTDDMLNAGAQAIVNDIWHPPQPLGSISPSEVSRHRRTSLLVLKAALAVSSTDREGK